MNGLLPIIGNMVERPYYNVETYKYDNHDGVRTIEKLNVFGFTRLKLTFTTTGDKKWQT